MRGRILFNGNGGSELVSRAAPYVRPAVAGRSAKVMMVTAAWGPGEYNEAPVRSALYAAGVAPDVQAGHDRNVFNLCAWHTWTEFLQRRPDVAAVYREIESVTEALRSMYLEKTAFHADLIRRAARAGRERLAGFSIGRVRSRDFVRPESVQRGSELFERALGRELVASIDALVENDARMLEAFSDAELQLLARTGLRLDPEWREVRARLEERILSADALLFFGGSPTKLLAPFRFFDLAPALLESLRRGATFVASSAGALVLCERMIVYDAHASDPLTRDFQLLDRGLGLVGGIQILPHCMDRIQTDDGDNLAYLARRFSQRICAGLNEESYLLIELEGPTATSVGERDGVYVFGEDGVKTCYRSGERISLEG